MKIEKFSKISAMRTHENQHSQNQTFQTVVTGGVQQRTSGQTVGL